MAQKVLYTASSFSHILNFHIPYLKWFRDRGYEVHVACGGVADKIPYADRVISLPFEKSMLSPKNLRAAKSLRALVKAEGYELISTHTSLAAFFTRLAVKGLKGRPRVVYICHGYLFDDDTEAAKRALLLTAERLTASETDVLMTMNGWDHKTAEKYRLGKRIVRIPGMGVDFERLEGSPAAGRELREKLNIPEDAFVLIYPAEFSKRKSQRVAIEALEKLPESVFLLLPGDGALLEECRELVKSMGLEGRVVFPGQIGDMAPWYDAADAAVTASRSEGLPFNVMEAMYRGLPVVASEVKGHVDLIKDGVTGLLYPYGDAGACAGAILRLMTSATARQELSRNAKASAEQYSLQSVLPQVTEYYM